MRHVLGAAALLAGALLFVQTTADMMEVRAKNGHEASIDFNPGVVGSPHAPVPASIALMGR